MGLEYFWEKDRVVETALEVGGITVCTRERMEHHAERSFNRMATIYYAVPTTQLYVQSWPN